ncbi:MAG TPA: antitermination protein NusG [Planctomycetes bacterium]|nr:antitermination protein NusG [Planctomycetota bacterium]
MPVLQREVDLFPEDLLERDVWAEVNGRSWWAMHCRPRQEKSLARDLLAQEIGFYLPLRPCRYRTRRRVITSHVPLFPSYVFVFADEHQRVEALRTQRVVRALDVPDQLRLQNDLQKIRRLLESGMPVTPEDRLEPGTPVEIRSGPLRGMTGTIVRSMSRQRFVVYVDFLQQGASVLIDDVDLRVIV